VDALGKSTDGVVEISFLVYASNLEETLERLKDPCFAATYLLGGVVVGRPAHHCAIAYGVSEWSKGPYGLLDAERGWCRERDFGFVNALTTADGNGIRQTMETPPW
jgi:hypothetical protein